SGTTLHQYDQLGRLNTIDYNNGIRQLYSYDRADRFTSFQLKQGSVTEMDLTYSYDQLGRLTVVRDQGKAYRYQYDAAGRITKEENGVNGISTDYTYYDSGHIKSLNHFSGDNSLLDAYQYRYDQRGNQVEKIENGDLTRYYYDSLSRLKTAILPDNTIQNYEFDDLNNIKSMAEIAKITGSQSLIKETTYSYDRNSRLLLAETIAGNQTEQQRFTYDKEGNQLSKEENTKYQGNQTASKEYTYQYNGYNQLSRVIDPNQKIIEYTYNGTGLRTKKDFIGHAIQYYYNGQNIVLETDQNNRITAKNIRGNQLISRHTEIQSFYYLHNAHGDVTALTDKIGKVIKDYSYDPYGNEQTNPINLFGKNATTELWRQEIEQIDNPFRYCGEYLDEETGNIYLRARYY
ncbi:hypothetical protein EOM86_13275, partial [Candidatus Nomurabacteria bacterium]|nr:hypothetical protein [Candidatus Nomurabacteria bacterium]